MIFEDLEDHKRILNNGSYFMNSASLFMRHSEPCYNSEKEQFLATPIWVRIYSLLEDLWEMDILESIGNSIGDFVQVSEITESCRFSSYAKISVYMNISQPLPELVEIEY